MSGSDGSKSEDFTSVKQSACVALDVMISAQGDAMVDLDTYYVATAYLPEDFVGNTNGLRYYCLPLKDY